MKMFNEYYTTLYYYLKTYLNNMKKPIAIITGFLHPAENYLENNSMTQNTTLLQLQYSLAS